VILRVCEGPHSHIQSIELCFVCFTLHEVSPVVVDCCVSFRSQRRIERGWGGLLTVGFAFVTVSTYELHLRAKVTLITSLSEFISVLKQPTTSAVFCMYYECK
jgi:hypothetical protein